MEILDVVDETGAPTGETVERAEASPLIKRLQASPALSSQEP